MITFCPVYAAEIVKSKIMRNFCEESSLNSESYSKDSLKNSVHGQVFADLAFSILNLPCVD